MVNNEAHESKARSMQALLVPLDEHPARELIGVELNVRDMVDAPLPLPWGMVWSPASCENYLEQAIPEVRRTTGWMRSTNRQEKDFSHHHFYLETIAEVPGGADLNRIRDTALTCQNGTLTLDYQVTGTVNYSERPPLELDNANTLAMQIDISFGPAENADAAKVLRKYRYGDGKEPVSFRKEIVYVALGETLITTLSPQENFAREMATAIYERVSSSK